MARPPEIGPTRVRVLPARDNGQGGASDGEGKAPHPQPGHQEAEEAELMLGEGKSIAEVAKVLEVSEVTFHRWRAQYGGMRPTMPGG